jgi:hypothetical protein
MTTYTDNNMEEIVGWVYFCRKLHLTLSTPFDMKSSASTRPIEQHFKSFIPRIEQTSPAKIFSKNKQQIGKFVQIKHLNKVSPNLFQNTCRFADDTSENPKFQCWEEMSCNAQY